MDAHHKQNLLPNQDDGLSDEDSEYWYLKNYCYLACNGWRNPHLVEDFFSKTSYYKVFELVVQHIIYNS